MLKVLLVDDEPLALEGLKLVVDWERLGYIICGECRDGEEAVSLIEVNTPDVVITDIRMPVLDGLGLIEKVRDRMGPFPKFIIVSGHGEFEYARKALRYGISHYLLKPVFPEELSAILLDIQSQPGASPPPGLAESEMSPRDPGTLFNEIAYLDMIIEALEELNPEKLDSAIELAFGYFQKMQPPPEIVKMYVINIIYHSIGLINEMNGSSTELLHKYNLARLDERKTTPLELKNILKGFSAECCAYLKSLKDRDSQINIYKIEEYLRDNFKRNLTIKEIAKNFYLHPAYLGQLFQKTFGVSFNEYLHKMRIEEAMRLMDGGVMKTCEIALEVGYNSYHSFLQNFEKYARVKPAEYKNINQRSKGSTS